MRLLLSGVPGGGKTTVGQRLASDHGFVHVDMEADNFRLAVEARQDPQGFLDGLPAVPLVLTWGFGPLSGIEAVTHILRSGFSGVWFDGERHHFLASFLGRDRRDPAQEVGFYSQMILIIATDVANKLPWRRFDPFEKDGSFKREPARLVLDLMTGNG